MIHGYHVVLPMYGFWLPNDARGSWSEFISKWELVRFGMPCKTIERRELGELSLKELADREAAIASLDYPQVSLTERQIGSTAKGIANHSAKNNYTLWACSILPEHTHLVIARHTFKVEQMANLLKGAATRELAACNDHPLKSYTKPGHRPPQMWASHLWKVYLDTEEAIENAIAYVRDNPAKEGRREQAWDFVTPFAGIAKSEWITYH